jgi:hypothetical protein
LTKGCNRIGQLFLVYAVNIKIIGGLINMKKKILCSLVMIFVCYNGFSQNIPESILNDDDIKIFIEEWENISHDFFSYNEAYTDDENNACEDYEDIIESYKQEIGLFLMPSFIPPGMIVNININEIMNNYNNILYMDLSNFIEDTYKKHGLKNGHQIYFVLTIGSLLFMLEDINENERNNQNYKNEILPMLNKVEMIKSMIHNNDLLLIKKYLPVLPDLL